MRRAQAPARRWMTSLVPSMRVGNNRTDSSSLSTSCTIQTSGSAWIGSRSHSVPVLRAPAARHRPPAAVGARSFSCPCNHQVEGLQFAASAKHSRRDAQRICPRPTPSDITACPSPTLRRQPCVVRNRAALTAATALPALSHDGELPFAGGGLSRDPSCAPSWASSWVLVLALDHCVCGVVVGCLALVDGHLQVCSVHAY